MATYSPKPPSVPPTTSSSAKESSSKKSSSNDHSTDSSISSNPSASYTMVGDRDLESIGAHCHYTYCHQLDFLPFRCESCRQTYCLDHRTEDSHACPQKGQWAAARRKAQQSGQDGQSPQTAGTSLKPTLSTGTQCSEPVCKTFVNTHTSVGVLCQTCGRTYCLKHRLPESHACASLPPLHSRLVSGPTAAQRASTALARLRAWGKEKAEHTAQVTAFRTASSSSTNRSAAARIAALNTLKQKAKGDARVPSPMRVYLHVEFEAGSTAAKLPRGDMYFSGDWSIGRMLDDAARGLQVANLNNHGGGEEQKLRVFHVEGGRMLEFSEKVNASGLKSGDTAVLLRGVGPPVPDLIQA